MSGRKLGGGRILGTGKGLAPPSPAQAPRATSPFAPSESSTVSFHSRNSTPSSISPPSSGPLPDFNHDLVSNINMAGPSDGASTDTRLLCPICEEEMLTLLQLNRHIDDVHQELPEAEHDEVKTWLDKQVLKAKRFQPLSIINQKLRGLDVFESNETQTAPLNAPTGSSSRTHDTPAVIDPEELVTRKHWQRPTSNDVCTDPPCERRLGPLNGSINCRKCGRLFCEEHTMYQMKLSRSAGHDPVRGVWCRVCETCYKSREGYNDHNGFLRDHSEAFFAVRRKKVERQNLEIARLEKRLTKLTTLLANPPEELPSTPGGGILSPVATLAGQKNQRKLLEQSVVTWEDDAKVAKCPFCQQEFGSWTFRRHHCRICGQVVCADPQTECSTEVGLNVQRAVALASEKRAGDRQVSLDIRMCRDCKTTIFSKRDFAESVAHKPPDQRAYETLRQFERGIRQLMPSFQRTMMALQLPEDNGDLQRNGSGPLHKPPPTHAQIQEAAKIRKRLTDSFTKYNMAAKRLRDLKTDSATQQKLQQAIYTAASSFLHTHMLPLKSVPRMLKSGSSSSNHRRLLSGLNGSSTHLSPLRNGESAASSDPDTASLGGASEASTAVSALETEEKELRERLVVLEEQRFLVTEMVNSARGSRRFEEVSALTRNVEELDREIDSLKKQVSGVEERWEGLYAVGI
ncbi:FYVE zinc finger-domain-containing protein [Coniochaeta sp. 2T2.1]|nr:FYVE zinc finger-domain-containing protein [Coniochaeta sp. 2T2.1]